MASRFDGRYAKEFIAGWGTMDFNGHMANTAYLNLAADVRMAFFAEHGFPPSEFRRLALGPVIRKEENAACSAGSCPDRYGAAEHGS